MLKVAKCLWIVLLLLPVLFFSGCSRKDAEKENMSYVWGRADAKEIDINSKIAGRVVKLLVREGETVEQGQPLAYIDNRDLMAQKSQIMANIESIRAQQNQAKWATAMGMGTTQAALSQARATAERARADLNMAETDYARYASLVQEGAVSRQSFEQYRKQYQVAQSAYAQAQAGVEEANAALMQTDVNRATEEALAKQLLQAEAALEQLMVSLDETEIKAPFSGVITAKYVEEGSMISLGTPLVAIQDPLDNWVNFKVPETHLGDFRLDQQVELVARDGSTKVQGTVVDISKKSEFATQRATSERGDASDIISFNVKVQVGSELLRPGMRFRLVGRIS